MAVFGLAAQPSPPNLRVWIGAESKYYSCILLIETVKEKNRNIVMHTPP